MLFRCDKISKRRMQRGVFGTLVHGFLVGNNILGVGCSQSKIILCANRGSTSFFFFQSFWTPERDKNISVALESISRSVEYPATGSCSFFDRELDLPSTEFLIERLCYSLGGSCARESIIQREYRSFGEIVEPPMYLLFFFFLTSLLT